MIGAKIYIHPTPTEDIDFSKLSFVPIEFERTDITPRTFGHDYDTWDDYYDANPDMKPEYCECCGHRV